VEEERKKELKEINTQTDDLIIPSFSIPPTTPRTFLESEREFNILRESQLNETNKFNKFIEVEERERKLKNENRALIKDLRKVDFVLIYFPYSFFKYFVKNYSESFFDY